jgi:hypothetical protein
MKIRRAGSSLSSPSSTNLLSVTLFSTPKAVRSVSFISTTYSEIRDHLL